MAFLSGNSTAKNAVIVMANGKPYVSKPDELYRQMIEMRDESLRQRRRFEQLWKLCWKYYKGDQWLKLHPDLRLEKIDVGKKPKITINRVMPVVLTRRAHALKNRPMGIVMPASSDEEDRNAARVAQDVVQFDYHHLKLWEQLDRVISMWMFITGNCFRKIYWDQSKGERRERNKYVTDPETGEPVIVPEQIPNPAFGPDALGEPEQIPNPEPLVDTPYGKQGPGFPKFSGREPFQTGDVCADTFLPIEFLPEPGARDLDDCERVQTRTFKPVHIVKRMFGKAASEVKAPDWGGSWGMQTLRGVLDFGQLTEKQMRNRVEVNEMYVRPDDDFPEGLYAVWADDKLMWAGPTPDAHDHIPFVHYQEAETDEFWGTSTVAQILDPQRALNINVSRDEYVRQRLRPKLVAMSDSGLDEDAWSSDETEINFVSSPKFPEYVEPPNFSRDEKAVGYWEESIDDISGSMDIMRGQVTGSAIRSGEMVNSLQEYAGTVLANATRAIERGEEKTVNMILRLRKHYNTDPFFYQIVGRNKHVEVKSFMASDIKGAGDYIVQAGSAIPTSQAAKRDMAFRLAETLIVPPGDPRLLKLVGMPADIDEMFDEGQRDRDNATEENHRLLSLTEDDLAGFVQQAEGENMQEMLESGTISFASILYSMNLEARSFEDHDVHIESHDEDVRKTSRYRELPRIVQAVIDAHVQMHQEFKFAALMASQMPVAPTEPGPSEPPAK